MIRFPLLRKQPETQVTVRTRKSRECHAQIPSSSSSNWPGRAGVERSVKGGDAISAICRGFLPGTPRLACLSMRASLRLLCGRGMPVGRAGAILRPHFKQSTKKSVFFNTFDLPRTRRAMHLRCSHSLTPNGRGCCGAAPLALRAEPTVFAHSPPFYTQLADRPRARAWPYESRGLFV